MGVLDRHVNGDRGGSGVPGLGGRVLPPIRSGRRHGDGVVRFKGAIDMMKEKGMIEPRKMDLALLVRVLFSEGEWEQPHV